MIKEAVDAERAATRRAKESEIMAEGSVGDEVQE